MSSWIATYKCRLCGEQFQEEATHNGKSAELAVWDLAYNDADNRESAIVVTEHGKHECADGSYGFADFIGFKKKE